LTFILTKNSPSDYIKITVNLARGLAAISALVRSFESVVASVSSGAASLCYAVEGYEAISCTDKEIASTLPFDFATLRSGFDPRNDADILVLDGSCPVGHGKRSMKCS
jgi:hypothetical protein